MGTAASVGGEYTPDEKIVIAQSLKSKYETLQKDEALKGSDTEIFAALASEFETVKSSIEGKRTAAESPSEENKSGSHVIASPSYDVNSSKFSFTDPSKQLTKSISEDPGVVSEKRSKPDTGGAGPPGKLIRAQTSSQLLSQANETALEDQTKIANFISQLKSGEIATKPGSEFRARRLTFSQQTAVEPEPVVEAKKPTSRTTIFSSTEIGVSMERMAPFPEDYLGTYSCHGIEPSYDEESGIHDKINQDRGCIVYPYHSSKEEALFIVIDGHGEQGDRVSEFVMRQIVVSLEKDVTLDTDPSKALSNTYIMTNTALMVTPINYITSGCTCVTVYLKGKRLYVANVGDSRAVMAYKDENSGKVLARDLTRDHKPDDPDEQARITSWGGYVLPPPEPGLSARVYLNPECTMIGLAMSRSIGDHAVKSVGVIPEPEVTIFDLQPNDDYMIMASDGVWEFISSQEAVDIVNDNLDKGSYGACQVLIEVATQRWQEEEGDYRDDITAIIVKFPLPYMK